MMMVSVLPKFLSVFKVANRQPLTVDTPFLYGPQIATDHSGMNLANVRKHLDWWLMTMSFCALLLRPYRFEYLCSKKICFRYYLFQFWYFTEKL